MTDEISRKSTSSDVSLSESELLAIEYELNLSTTSANIPRQPRSFYRPIPKSYQWYQLIMPLLPDSRYLYFFRVTKNQYKYILEELIGTNDRQLQYGNVSIEKKLHMYLYFVGNNPYVVEFDDRFAISNPMKFVRIVADVITTHLYSKFVKWLSAFDKVRIKSQFEEFSGFKNIIGTVDGTHIQIIAQGKYKAGYISRKCIYAINATFVCDYDLKILFASIGCPGSYHDNKVWEYTPIFNSPEAYFTGLDIILGDTAYSETKFLVAPYKAVKRSEREKADFNYWHSRARVRAEHLIGYLKSKWKLLGTIIRVKDLTNKVLLIKSVVPVQNMLIDYNRRNCLPLEQIVDIDDDFESDLNIVRNLPQHMALGGHRASRVAANRKDLMRTQKI